MQRENHSLQSSKIDLVNKNNPAKTTEKEILEFFLNSFVHKLGRESGRVNFMRNSRISLLKLGMTIKRMTSNRIQHNFQGWGQ